jgi:hypothetical protein
LRSSPEHEQGTKKTTLQDLSLSVFGVVGDAEALRPHLKRFSLWK